MECCRGQARRARWVGIAIVIGLVTAIAIAGAAFS